MTAPSPASSAAPGSMVREYDVSARSTDIFGRVLCSARTHHFIVDGPVQNNCPGEEITPAESFLSGVAACGVELIHVIGKDQGVSVDRVTVDIHGLIDRANPARPDLTTFNSVQLTVTLWGPKDIREAEGLVDGFTKRCPLYGTVAAATKDVRVTTRLGSA